MSDVDSDDDYSDDCDRSGKIGDYNEVRGSRTNCKGHWSKEEVRYNIIFFLLINFMIIGSTFS